MHALPRRLVSVPGSALLVVLPAREGPIDAAAQQGGFRGQVLIRCAEGVSYEAAFGSLTPDGQTAIDAESVFCVGSIAKAMTSTVVLPLAVEGKLKLEAGWAHSSTMCPWTSATSP